MATLEATLQTLLGNLCSGRCSALANISSTIVCPYITFQKIHGAELVVCQDNADREATRFQFDVWDKTYNGAKVLAAQAKTAIDTSTAFASSLITNFDGYEEASKEFRVTLEFYIWL